MKKFFIALGSFLAAAAAVFLFFFKRNRTSSGGLAKIEKEKREVDTQLADYKKQMEQLEGKQYSDSEIEEKYNKYE